MDKYNFIRIGAVVRFKRRQNLHWQTGVVRDIYSDAVIFEDTRILVHLSDNGQMSSATRYADELVPFDKEYDD